MRNYVLEGKTRTVPYPALYGFYIAAHSRSFGHNPKMWYFVMHHYTPAHWNWTWTELDDVPTACCVLPAGTAAA